LQFDVTKFVQFAIQVNQLWIHQTGALLQERPRLMAAKLNLITILGLQLQMQEM